MDHNDRLLKDLVEHFNRGVETGNFVPLLRLFSDDAVLTFHAGDRGPFIGRDGIEAGYSKSPPADEMEILDSHVRDGQLVVGFSWLREADVRAGEMRITLEDDMVKTMEITE